MTDTQAFLLKMLKEIDVICTRHAIPYFLAGGTLIGAVRHRGFLPWDDDVDIYMTRSGWERFVEVCKTELPQDRILQAPDLDTRYHNTFPRYLSTDTTAIHIHQILDDSPAGLVIDIFVLDPLPDNPDTLKRYTYDLMLYSDLLNYSIQCGRRFGVSEKDYRRYARMQKQKGEETVRRLFEEKLATYLDDRGSKYVMRWGGNILIFERSWFDNPFRLRFVDFDAMVPNGINEYLVYRYGDEWTQVPQYAEQTAHDTASSLSFSFEYVRDKQIVSPKKREQLIKMMDRRKRNLLRIQEFDLAVGTEGLRIQAQCHQLELEERYARSGLDATKISQYDDLVPFLSLFQNYLSWQLSSAAIGRDDFVGAYRFHHPVLADIDDDLFHAACYVLFFTQRIGKAKRLLDIRNAQQRLSPQLDKLNKAIEVFRTATNYHWHNRSDKAQQLLDDLIRVYPNNPSILKLQCEIHLSNLPTSKQGFQELLDHARAQFPDDGDFIKYQGDLLFLAGDIRQATALYQRAFYLTNNGMNLLDILDKSDRETLDLDEKARRSYSPLTRPQSSLFHSEKQERLFLLFNEICDLCDSAQIPYVIHPLMALWMLKRKKLPPSISAFSVIVHPKYSECLLEAFNRAPRTDRSIEYLGNNSKYPSFTFRYVDTSTTAIVKSLRSPYQIPGFSVSILLLQPYELPLISRKLINWRTSGAELKSGSPIKSTVITSVSRLYTRLGLKPAQTLFATWERAAERQVGGIIDIGSKKRSFPAWLISKTRMIVFNERAYPVPDNLKAYFTIAYGDDYLSRLRVNSLRGSAIDAGSSFVESCLVPYDKFLRHVGSFDIYVRNKSKVRFRKARSELAYKSFREIYYNIKLVVAVEDILIRYAPVYEEVLKLYREDDLYGLTQKLEDFARVAEEYPSASELATNQEFYYVFINVMARTGRIKEPKLSELKKHLRSS